MLYGSNFRWNYIKKKKTNNNEKLRQKSVNYETFWLESMRVTGPVTRKRIFEKICWPLYLCPHSSLTWQSSRRPWRRFFSTTWCWTSSSPTRRTWDRNSEAAAFFHKTCPAFPGYCWTSSSLLWCRKSYSITVTGQGSFSKMCKVKFEKLHIIIAGNKGLIKMSILNAREITTIVLIQCSGTVFEVLKLLGR